MTSAKDLQRGNYILLNNEILQVTRKENVTCGTHCHSKTKLFLQILSSKGEKVMNFNHEDGIEVLDIQKKTAQVISKMQDKVQIMDAQSYETLDADADKDLLNEIEEGDEVIFISFQGKTKILERKRKI